jgi:putative lipoprotein
MGMNALLMLGVGSFLAIAMTGCNHSNPIAGGQSMATVKVEAFYRERMMVPPGSVLRVTLSDVSKMDVAATLISEVVRENPGAPPYRVELEYNPAEIDQRFHYAVRATLSAEGKLLFTTTEFIDAFAGADDATVPVTMQRVEEARNPQSQPQASLTNTYWKLMTLAGKPASIGAGGKELRLQLTEQDKRFHGFAGCNNYSGSYKTTADNGLELGQAMSTRMACVEGMEQEQVYLAMLSEVAAYDINGENLHLLDTNGAELASFESRYMQ